MGFTYEEKPSASPFVEAVWRTEDTADGMYLAAADGAWDLIFTERDGNYRILLSGPSSRATPVPYQTGNRNFGIRFRPGVFMPTLPANKMVNVVGALPKKTKHRFWLQGESWQLPTFDSIDEFLAKLSQRKLLAKDGLVAAVLSGQHPGVTERSVQRHFMHAVGLTPQYVQNIQRANHAVSLLQKGESITDTVIKLGYADQAHLTRHVKRASGRTPGEVIKKVEECRLRSIQNYGVCAQMKVQNFKGGSTYGDKTVQNSN